MSENINFIPAAELPITAAKEVDVLCVENGELKRKAGANLGGGGYVIHVQPDDLIREDSTTEITIMVSESRDNFGPILEAGGTVWLDLSRTVLGIMMGGGTVRLMASGWMFTEGTLALASFYNNVAINTICMNGTWAPSEG